MGSFVRKWYVLALVPSWSTLQAKEERKALEMGKGSQTNLFESNGKSQYRAESTLRMTFQRFTLKARSFPWTLYHLHCTSFTANTRLLIALLHTSSWYHDRSHQTTTLTCLRLKCKATAPKATKRTKRDSLCFDDYSRTNHSKGTKETSTRSLDAS